MLPDGESFNNRNQLQSEESVRHATSPESRPFKIQESLQDSTNTVATLPNSLLEKKRLFVAPFLYTPLGEHMERTYDQVPSVFKVLRETDSLVLLADSNGKKLGWAERTHAFDWNTRLTLRQTRNSVQQIAGMTFTTLEGATALQEGVIQIHFSGDNGPDFPVLELKKIGGRTMAKVGPPFTGGAVLPGVTFPAWTEVQSNTSFGVLMSEKRLRQHQSLMELLFERLRSCQPPEERRNLAVLLKEIDKERARVMTGQSFALKEDEQIGRSAKPMYEGMGLEIPTLEDIRSFNDQDFEAFLRKRVEVNSIWKEVLDWKNAPPWEREQIKRNLQNRGQKARFEGCIKGARECRVHEPGGDRSAKFVIPIAALALE